MSGRRSLHGYLLDLGVAVALGAGASTVSVVVIRGVLGGPMWLSLLASIVAMCVACWRLSVWNERQDELEAKRAEVET